MTATPPPQLCPLGADGVLVRFSNQLEDPANRAALAFRSAVDAMTLPGVTETATSLTSVFLRFKPDQVARAALESTLHDMLQQQDWTAAPLPAGRTLWHVPAAFDGADAPDLEEVATLTGLSTQDAVAQVTGQSLRVLALGFAPGQPYLGFLPGHWDIPRQTDVTPQVPRGAVVVAVRQVIPFANPSPTGWRQIGRTAFRCYAPGTTPPLPLKAGDEIQFGAVTATELARLENDPRGGADTEALP